MAGLAAGFDALEALLALIALGRLSGHSLVRTVCHRPVTWSCSKAS